MSARPARADDPATLRIGRRERALWREPFFWLVLALFAAESVTGLAMTFLPLGIPRLGWFEIHLWVARAFVPLFAVFLYRHTRGVGGRRVYVVMFGYWLTLFVMRFLGGNSLFLILPLTIFMLWWMWRALVPWMRGLDPAAAGISYLVFVAVQITMATGIGTHLDVMLVDRPFMRHQGIFSLNFAALHQWAGILLPLLAALHLGLRRLLAAVPVSLQWLRRVRARSLAPLVLASMFGVVAWNWNLRHHAEKHPEAYEDVAWVPTEKAEFCGKCHWDEYRQWSVSLHRFAAENELYAAAVRVTVERHGAQAVAFCHRCHDPTYELRQRADAAGELSEGVTCVSCHRVVEVPSEPRNGDLRIGRLPIPAGEDATQPAFLGRLVRSIEADSRGHRHDMNPIKAQATICQSCHRVDMSVAGLHGVLVEDTASSWFEGPYGKAQDNSCVLCHMPRIKSLPWEQREARGHKHPHHGVFGLNEGLSVMASGTGVEATLAERDATVAELIREFPGLSAIQQISQFSHGSFDPLFKFNQRLALRPLTIDLTVEPIEAGRLAISLATTNVRGGHALPAGADDLSETWLSVELTDASGRAFALSGAMGADGERDPTALELGARWLDRNGEPLRQHDLFSLGHVADERRIKFAETLRDRIEVPRPDGLSGRVVVRATWNYRRVRPHAALDLLGAPRAFPVTRLGEGEVEVTLAPLAPAAVPLAAVAPPQQEPAS
ncbi:MAG: multiheme c-type cytochrome [bacterium]